MFSVLLQPNISFAQTATPLSKVGFDQVAPDLATANSYVYRIYVNAATTGQVATTICTGTSSPFTCTFALPALTPGKHSLTITAGNAAGESAKSAPVAFEYVVIPSTPTNPRIL